ncbi:MAG: hypothetical protein ABR598_02205 [Candidatus Dormibacteria bacterium]
MDVALHLASGFVECLWLVLALDAARRGRPLYWGAVAGLALVLYGRMTEGMLSGTFAIGPLNLSTASLLTLTGLVIAALTVVLDLMFEMVDEPREEAEPSV